MRTLLLALLATAALPGIAQAQDAALHDDRYQSARDHDELNRDVRDGAPPREIRQDVRDLREDQRDQRYDWRAWRQAHPDYYRGPAWSGPRGGGYRPVEVGYRFGPEYYDRRYWIDPVRYHLHPVPGAQRWVRYGPDVLLVDMRSGRVLEVNRAFFF